MGRVLVESSVALQACRVGESLAMDDVGLIIIVLHLLTKIHFTRENMPFPEAVWAQRRCADMQASRVWLFGRLAMPLLQATG